jgi:hypothetical protein
MVRTENKSYFHFCVYNGEDDNGTYYRTCDEISDSYGCSRGTIYNIINNPDAPRRKFKELRIVKDYLHHTAIEKVPQDSYIKETSDLINSA